MAFHLAQFGVAGLPPHAIVQLLPIAQRGIDAR
jgi:hypothetical protein